MRGVRGRPATYLAVWHRGRVGELQGRSERADPAEIVLPVAHLRDLQVAPEVLYPVLGGAGLKWSAQRGELTVAFPRTPSACLIGLG
jgi:hypothetical protein